MPRGVRSYVVQPSLTFGANTTDRVDCGSGSLLDDLDPITIIGWFCPTTLTSGRGLIGKGDATVTRKRLRWSGTGGNIDWAVFRTTTNGNLITNNTPCATLNKWYCIMVTFSSTAPSISMFVGDLNTPMVSPTFGTNTVGSNTVTSDAAGNFVIGNCFSGAALVLAFQGDIGPCAVFNAVLTQAQGQLWQAQSWERAPRLIAGANAARGCWRLGDDGTVPQRDLSGNGNTGTVTGAIAVRNTLVTPIEAFHRLGRQPRPRALV